MIKLPKKLHNMYIIIIKPHFFFKNEIKTNFDFQRKHPFIMADVEKAHKNYRSTERNDSSSQQRMDKFVNFRLISKEKVSLLKSLFADSFPSFFLSIKARY